MNSRRPNVAGSFLLCAAAGSSAVYWSSEFWRQGHVALALPPPALVLQSGEPV